VVITADDGYSDFYEVAFPLLREFQLPAMLFVVTGFLDGKTWFWWDRLEHMLAQAEPCRLELPFDQQTLEVDLTSSQARNQTWHRIADRCRFLPDETKESLLAQLARQLGIDPTEGPPPGYRPLTWEQLQDMIGQGLQVGAHTVHHPVLTRVTLQTARSEIIESGRRLSEKIGRPVRWFCYPQGGPADFNSDLQEIVREADYDGCYIAYQDLERPQDRYAMPRYCVTSDMTEFRWVLCGAEYLGLRLRHRLGLGKSVADSYWAGADGEDLSGAAVAEGKE
jgi:peptidoglycan/xylan/chitin deacetylase (PgdA/CDA1 family)